MRSSPRSAPESRRHPMFLRDQWYVGAWSDEVGRVPLGRTILGEDIVFYRTEAGVPVALANSCADRRFRAGGSRERDQLSAALRSELGLHQSAPAYRLQLSPHP